MRKPACGLCQQTLAGVFVDDVQNAKDLADTVTSRTAELNDRIRDLELLNKSMVGRELKMVELKNKIKEIEEEKLEPNN